MDIKIVCSAHRVQCGFATVVGKLEKTAVVEGFLVQLNAHVCWCWCVNTTGEQNVTETET